MPNGGREARSCCTLEQALTLCDSPGQDLCCGSSATYLPMRKSGVLTNAADQVKYSIAKGKDVIDYRPLAAPEALLSPRRFGLRL